MASNSSATAGASASSTTDVPSSSDGSDPEHESVPNNPDSAQDVLRELLQSNRVLMQSNREILKLLLEDRQSKTYQGSHELSSTLAQSDAPSCVCLSGNSVDRYIELEGPTDHKFQYARRVFEGILRLAGSEASSRSGNTTDDHHWEFLPEPLKYFTWAEFDGMTLYKDDQHILIRELVSDSTRIRVQVVPGEAIRGDDSWNNMKIRRVQVGPIAKRFDTKQLEEFRQHMATAWSKYFYYPSTSYSDNINMRHHYHQGNAELETMLFKVCTNTAKQVSTSGETAFTDLSRHHTARSW